MNIKYLLWGLGAAAVGLYLLAPSREGGMRGLAQLGRPSSNSSGPSSWWMSMIDPRVGNFTGTAKIWPQGRLLAHGQPPIF